MNRSLPFVALILIGTPSLPAETPAAGIEQQLRSRYRITRVGANGTVIGQPGSVLVMQEDGLIAVPATFGYWRSTLKKGGKIRPGMMQPIDRSSGGTLDEAVAAKRPFQVGEKLYLTNMEIGEKEIILLLQSCGKCDLSVDQNDPPYRARLALGTAAPDHILETLSRLFGIDTAPPEQEPQQPKTILEDFPRHPELTVSLKLPAIYVSTQTPTDQLQLNADNSFSLQEAGQTCSGMFTIKGNTLELAIKETNTKSLVTIQGNELTDSSRHKWVLQEQPLQPARPQEILTNHDIANLANAKIDDATIIAMISSSKCQFDTSAAAVIRLKQSGVSTAVIKAMVGAAK